MWNNALFCISELDLDCLGTWSDGEDMYMYGRLNGSGISLADRDISYRCFVSKTKFNFPYKNQDSLDK